MDREPLLLATLRDWRRTAFVWGQSDCIASLMTYAQGLCGVDPGAHWRGTYGDRYGAQAIVEAAGGTVPLIAGMVGPYGFRRVQLPEPGDMIVAEVISGREIAGLWLGAFAAFRLERGVIEVKADKVKVLAAWR